MTQNMDRRDFLRLAGFGGGALTMPKPLEVLAAKVADLTDPPLHVGFAHFNVPLGTTIYEFGVEVDFFSHKKTFAEYDGDLHHWRAHMGFLNRKEYLPALDGAVEFYAHKVGAIDSLMHPLIVPEPTEIEIWIVPTGHPKLPMPRMWVKLGASLKGEPDCIQEFSQVVKSVRLERSRAIEMGLALSSDPFEVF